MDASVKILFVCTEDWFFYSHFRPLAKVAMARKGYSASVVCGTGHYQDELEAGGLNVIPLDFSRKSLSLFSSFKLLYRLASIFRAEKPDIIHLISHKPIVLGGLAALALPNAGCVFHLTGEGFLAIGKSPKIRFIRTVFHRLVSFFLKRSRTWLIVENPDDKTAIEHHGKVPLVRATIFGGAGVDPVEFPLLPPPDNYPARIAFIGRLVWSKGVDVLVESMRNINHSKTIVTLHIYGTPDSGNPRPVSGETLNAWTRRDNVCWHGHASEISQVWAATDIAVFPSRGGEGLPRSLLEAAACGRPLIVTGVPGCRQFVRDGVEGLIVAPNDSNALAVAISKLALDPKLRDRMGQAARSRLLESYTEAHICDAADNIYQTLMRPV